MSVAATPRGISATSQPRRPFASRPAGGGLARSLLLCLLMLGALLRPMLILACEHHAAVFAHADQPHAHAGEDGGADEGAHGDHQQSQFSAPGGAADVPPLHRFALTERTGPVPARAPTPLWRDRSREVPLRPPIG